MWSLHVFINNITKDDMDNWLAKRIYEVDSLHVEIDNLVKFARWIYVHFNLLLSCKKAMFNELPYRENWTSLTIGNEHHGCPRSSEEKCSIKPQKKELQLITMNFVALLSGSLKCEEWTSNSFCFTK